MIDSVGSAPSIGPVPTVRPPPAKGPPRTCKPAASGSSGDPAGFLLRVLGQQQTRIARGNCEPGLVTPYEIDAATGNTSDYLSVADA